MSLGDHLAFRTNNTSKSRRRRSTARAVMTSRLDLIVRGEEFF
jgi:hypothetical protein